jgi:lysophospholipase L1-like esterase
MRRWVGAALLAATGVVAALALMEALVRLTGLGAPPGSGDGATAPPLPEALRGLPELRGVGELARPNVRGVYQGVLHRTNSAGMRGPEVTLRPPPGVFRIAVIGDSITMGHGVEEEQTYVARVERALNETGPGRYELLNLGVSGMNIHHSVKRLIHLGLDYEPDLIVYGFTLNDIEGPAYVANTPEDQRAYLRLLGRFADSRSALLRALWPRLVNLRSAWRPLPGSYEATLERNYFQRPRAWAQVARGLDRLAAIGRQRDVCVVVLVHPAVARLRMGHPFTRFYDHVQAEAEARGLFAVQAWPYFRGRDAARLRFNVVDSHPNAEGHRLLAEALLDGLRRLPARCGLAGSGERGAVDAQRDAVDVRGVVGGQEGDAAGHGLRAPELVERHHPVDQLAVRAFRELEGLLDGCGDGAGTERVRAQSLLAVLDGERARQRQHAALRRGVGRRPGMSGQGGRGGHVHDVAARLQQVGKGVPAHQEGARQVDRQDAAPVLEGDLVAVAEPEDAGHVAQHVQPSEAGHRARHGRAHLLRVRDVGDFRLHVGAELPRQLGGLLQPGGLHVGQEEGGSLLAQALGGGAPDARGRAGDQHAAILETSHGDIILAQSRSGRRARSRRWLDLRRPRLLRDGHLAGGVRR